MQQTPRSLAAGYRRVAAPAVQPSNKDRMVRGTSLFTAIHNLTYKPGPSGERIIEEVYHPLHLQTKRKYEARERTGLWWHALVGTSVSPRRVVRNWCARRMRNAFKEALGARGMDEYGRVKIDGRGISSPPLVRGYMRMQASPKTLTANNAMLRKECLAVLDEVIRLCREWPEASNGKSVRSVWGSNLGLKGTGP